MHPAPSLILFTTFSGAGFGLMFWLGLGLPAPTGVAAFVAWGAGYALSVGGLVASAFHLRRPERALRAFTQWRTSWLSREGWAASATLLLLAPTAAAAVFAGRRLMLPGLAGAALCLVTVAATGMIYAQLRTVPRWHRWETPAGFLLLALAGGALLALNRPAALPLLVAAALLQIWTWETGDRSLARAGSSTQSATGLSGGAVRAFEPPHSGPAWLTKEMLFVVGRRRSRQIRAAALGLGYVLPLCLLLLWSAPSACLLAAPVHFAGILAQRWLFYAEAEHVMGHWYGFRPPVRQSDRRPA